MANAIELSITGMTCDHCVKTVTEAIEQVPGVTAAKVNLETNSAIVEGDEMDLEKILAAVGEEGYTATPVAA